MAVDDNSVRFKHFKTSSSGKCVLGVVAPLPGKLFNFQGYLMSPAHLPTCIYMYVCILYILVSHTSTLTEFWAKWASVKSIFLPRRARSMETQRQDNRSYWYTPPWLLGLRLWWLCSIHSFCRVCVPAPLLDPVKLLTAWTRLVSYLNSLFGTQEWRRLLEFESRRNWSPQNMSTVCAVLKT